MPFKRVRVSARVFFEEDRGSLTIFSLFLLVVMLMVGGIAVDTIRHETMRSKLQSAIDRGVLAAADLDQSMTPTEVLSNYLATSGFDPDEHNLTVTSSEGQNFREVSASVSAPVPTFFMNMVGVETLQAGGTSTAREAIQKIEIALVLDISGSMAGTRLSLLKTAATQFVDTVIPTTPTDPSIALSIVPFSTQVNAGPELLKHYNISLFQDYSHCVDFAATDFTTSEISPSTRLTQTGHFAPWSITLHPSDQMFVCRPETFSRILPWEHNPTTVKTAINGLVASGNTSLDIGAKWGTALLDPTSQPVVSAKVAEASVDGAFAGWPLEYTADGALKVLVLMTDGANTSQYYLENQYRNGQSKTWIDENGPGTEDDQLSQYSNDAKDYYHFDTATYEAAPAGDTARRMNYEELWANISVHWWAEYLEAPAMETTAAAAAGLVYSSVDYLEKNTRTNDICSAAKNAGILVFTIGMETYGTGEQVLQDCASSAAHHFNVTGVEISTAFAAIATQIQKLRLTN